MLAFIYLFVVSAAAWFFSPMAQIPMEVEQVAQEVFDPGMEDEQQWSMDTGTFMKTYVLELDKEWEIDGKAAEWAPSTNGRPLQWGEEYRRMDRVEDYRKESRDIISNDQMAISCDGKFIALATNNTIRIYNMANKDLRAELVGHLGPVATMMFAPQVKSNQPDAQYTLLSQGASEPGRRSLDDTIIIWYLSGDGKHLTPTTPFDVETLATQAINAISPSLSTTHNLTTSALSDLHKDFLTALSTASTKPLQTALLSFPGSFPSFNSNPISPYSTHILHLSHNETTQHGMRPTYLLPQIHIRSLANPDKAIAILQGHTDAIMWASFSPTNPTTIASASWDGTYRIWDISTTPPSTKHILKPKHPRQNWTGAFSPCGRYILLSGTDNAAIYSVSTGELVHSLTEVYKHASWTRYLGWSSKTNDNAIALASGTEILLWEPFHSSAPNKCTAVVTLSREGDAEKERILDLFKEFQSVRWLNDDLVAAKAAKASWVLWDRTKNWKWRFTRPRGVEGDVYSEDCALVRDGEGRRVFVSLDGDRRVREWLLD